MTNRSPSSGARSTRRGSATPRSCRVLRGSMASPGLSRSGCRRRQTSAPRSRTKRPCRHHSADEPHSSVSFDVHKLFENVLHIDKVFRVLHDLVNVFIGPWYLVEQYLGMAVFDALHGPA